MTSRSKRGFTLVELLVVLAIIGVLAGALMPTIIKARRHAATVACAANLRTILQGMQLYGLQYKDAIVGGPNTSGAHLLLGANNNDDCPAISQTWDYQAPIARMLKRPFEEGGTTDQRIKRFTDLIESKLFSCSENEMIATAFTGDGGPNFPATTWISYSTAAPFLYLPFDIRFTDEVGRTRARSEYTPPEGYSPKLSRIGMASKKIFIAEGGRFTTTAAAPTMNLRFDATFGGAYSDVGAWSRFSRAWDRGKSPGNGASGSFDPRVFSYRHGNRSVGGGADSYRFNVGFYDGHVETMGDLEAANPELWAPRGTQMPQSEGYADVRAKYFDGKPDPYIVP